MGKLLSKRLFLRSHRTDRHEVDSSFSAQKQLVASIRKGNDNKRQLAEWKNLMNESDTLEKIGSDLPKVNATTPDTPYDGRPSRTSKASGNNALQVPTLTFHQFLAVQESWKSLSGYHPSQLGVQFFMRFFLTYPDYRNFYPHFRTYSDLANKEVNRRELHVLRNSDVLKGLATAYVDMLTTVLSKLDDLPELNLLLQDLIEQHLPRGVLHLHFQDMLSSLMTFVVEKTGHGHMTSVTSEAWLRALRLISAIIEDRYLEIQHKKHDLQES